MTEGPIPHEHEHDHEHDHLHDERARVEAVSKEGVHRAGEHEGPFSLHLLGLGKTGADIVTQALRGAGQTNVNALCVDIGDQDLGQVREAASQGPAGQVEAETVALAVPTREALLTALNRYREFLKMEYPRYYWNPNYEPWLPADLELPEPGQRMPRAVAKAIYNCEYYQNREITAALEAFAARVLSSEQTPLVCVIFSLAGGTGSALAVDISRHLSSIKLGRRPWVIGIGVLPCDGDPGEVRDGSLFPVINELDCMIDTEKNKGVMAVWGDLYKNPFTGGFFMAPQQDVFTRVKDLAATHSYIDEGIANFLVRDQGVHLYETLKATNWLGVSAATWHPAIRGEPSDRWINILAPRALDDLAGLGTAGLTKGFDTEYAEARVFTAEKRFTEEAQQSVREAIGKAAHTTVDPGVLHFDTDNGELVNVCILRASKLDLEAFVPSRDTYDELEWDEKLFRHSYILDLGVILCEPSIRFEGMGGECIWGCACWVVVPHAAIRGE